MIFLFERDHNNTYLMGTNDEKGLDGKKLSKPDSIIRGHQEDLRRLPLIKFVWKYLIARFEFIH
jgi:hypothetical protein